jgi:Ras-related GTP-binding protein C/D
MLWHVDFLSTNPENSSFMDFQVWDFPGHLNYFDPAFDSAEIFSEIGALIWVIDAQDEYLDAIARLNATILNLQTTYPAINVEVFVHKVDGLSDDYRSDTFRDIVQRVQDELSDAGVENAPVSFYQTSIYDHSIFEAFSKVIQKLIPELPTLEALLNSLCSNCRFEKAYLFDLMSKIYIATDTSPTDLGSYEICSDYIDVILDITEIYGGQPADLSKAIAAQVDGGGHGGHDEEAQAIERTNGPSSPDELQESGNGPAESLITMEKKGNYLYLREVNNYLCLICIMGDNSPTDGKALIDYNVTVFQDALRQVFPRQGLA